MIFKFEKAGSKPKKRRRPLFGGLLLIVHFSLLTVSAQKLAFPAADKASVNRTISEKLKTILSENFRVLDDSLAQAAARSFPEVNIYNLSAEEARHLGAAIGCDFFIVEKSETLRRASLYKADYYEAYAVVYLVSSRTGRLVFWKISAFEAGDAAEAEKKLAASMEDLAAEISASLKASLEKELREAPLPRLAELPAENSPEAKNFRSPLPFRRIKPEYTKLANLYGVTATVDALVDLDEKGRISRVEITRWAGYGLDESVTETIRKMQWRAAERDGKALPIRVLLRYNFKKTTNEDVEND